MKESNNTPKEIRELLDNAITLDAMVEHIKEMYKNNLNIFLWGDPGIGKTESVVQFVKEKQKDNPKFGYVYFPLASMEPADLIGIPTTRLVKDGNGVEQMRTFWATPSNLPTEKDWEGVLFFDEYNNAPAAMQNALQQLVQERRLGNYHLPDGARIIAAGNLSGQNAYSTELQAPVKDRFAHQCVKTNAELWTRYILNKYASAKNQLQTAMSDVVGFVCAHPDLLFDTAGMESGSYTFATPRSWERIIKLYGNADKPTETSLFHFFAQYIGSTNSHLLLEFIANKKKYQNANEILVEGKDFRDDKDINGFYSTFISVMSILNSTASDTEDKTSKKKVSEYMKNLMKAVHNMKRADWKTTVVSTIAKSTSLFKYLSITDIQAVAKSIKGVNNRQ